MANSILQGNMPFDRPVYSKTEIDKIVEEHSHYIVSPAGNTYIRTLDDGSGVIDRTIEAEKYASMLCSSFPRLMLNGFVQETPSSEKEIVWSWSPPVSGTGEPYSLDFTGPFTSAEGRQVYVPAESPVHDGFDPNGFYAGLWAEIVDDGGESVFKIWHKSDQQWFTFDENGTFEGHGVEVASGACSGTYYTDTPVEVISDSRVLATMNDLSSIVGTNFSAVSPIYVSAPRGDVEISHLGSGVMDGNYGESAARTIAPSGTFVVTRQHINGTGHVTSAEDVTLKLPNAVSSVSHGEIFSSVAVSNDIDLISSETIDQVPVLTQPTPSGDQYFVGIKYDVLKVPHALSFGGKEFDGSNGVEIDATDIYMGDESNDTVANVIHGIQEDIGGGGSGSIADRLDAVEGRLDSNDIRLDGIDARLDSNDEAIADIRDDYVSKTDRNDQEVVSNLLLSVSKVFALTGNTALRPEAHYVDATTYQRHGIVVSSGTGPEERTLSLSYPNAEGNRTIATREDLLSSILWSDLVALRGIGGLIPGSWYRITDYKATTVQEDTRPENHRFDIIVRADSTNKLNENAYAIKNAEDTTYFINSKLEAWELKYCLDNDTARFAWADSNGKGVVYWMKDEFGNECPYDFKGITMKAHGDTDNVFRYTFDSGDASNNTDYSLSGVTWDVRNNVIGISSSFNRRQLNRIIFKGSGCYSNTFGTNCSSNTFGSECASNTFGNGCYSNTFGDRCDSNAFGDGCLGNMLGAECQNNTFGGGCTSNGLGDSCYSNTFGYDCHYNKTGSYCKYNTFGDGCSGNTFGSSESSVLGYYQYIEFEPGVSNVVLHCDQSLSSESIYKNVVVLRGIGSVPITDHNVNQPFKTTYQPAGSQVISV